LRIPSAGLAHHAGPGRYQINHARLVSAEIALPFAKTAR
jgi:hypothetical protein